MRLLTFVPSPCLHAERVLPGNVVKGIVRDGRSREPLPFVNVLLDGTTQGATTDMNGLFTVENVKPGLYNVIASSVGLSPPGGPEVQVGTARPVELEILLEASATELKEVEINPRPSTVVGKSAVRSHDRFG
jgi:hypothetical protein